MQSLCPLRVQMLKFKYPNAMAFGDEAFGKSLADEGVAFMNGIIVTL